MKRLFSLLSWVLSFSLIFSPCSFALPELSEIVSGSADFNQEGNSLTVNTHTDKVVANYNSFSIGAGEIVTFNQPSASSVILNRVIGADPSSIFGSMVSNGQVFLVNPNGVFFSPGSRVDVAGLIASTLNISNADFLAGKYSFTGQGGYVLNQGTIMVKPGGYVCLTAGSVENQGVIQADLGTVVLASGEKTSLSLDDLGQINVVVEEAVKEALAGRDEAVNNSGSISAQGGKVFLTAKALNNVFENAVNNSGVIEAGVLNNKDGEIVLSAEGANVLNAGDLSGSKVDVSVSGDFSNEGKVLSNGTESSINGGTVNISASNIYQNGTVSANSYNLGTAGNIYFNSDYLTSLGTNSVTRASGAGFLGNGGGIYVNSLGDTVIAGGSVVDVSGGILGGNGGLLQICAENNLYISGTFLGSAQSGYSAGRLLFDPTGDITMGPATYSADTTIWTDANISIEGDILLDNSSNDVTLNIYADHASSTGGDWDNGSGAITSSSESYSISSSSSSHATTLNLKAGSGIGSLSEFIAVNVDNLSAELNPVSGTSASVYISALAGRDLNITGISDNSVAGTGTIQIVGPANITLSGNISSQRKLNLWASNVYADDYLDVADGNYSLDIDGNISVNAKKISLIADGDINFSTTSQVQSSGGAISIDADYYGDGNGSFVQGDGSSIDSGSGKLSLSFSGDCKISSLVSTSTTDPVTLSFTSLSVNSDNAGSITDYDNGAASIVAPYLLIEGNLAELNSAGVIMDVSAEKLSVGGFLDSSSGDIDLVNFAKDLEITELNSSGFGLQNAGSGGIYLSVEDNKALSLSDDVETSGGDIQLSADEGIAANADIKSDGGDILLDADLDDDGTGAFVQGASNVANASSGELKMFFAGSSSLYSLQGNKVKINLTEDASIGSSTSILTDYLLLNGGGYSLTSDAALTIGLMNMASPWNLQLSVGNFDASSSGAVNITNTAANDVEVTNWAVGEGYDFGLESGAGDISLTSSSKNIKVSDDVITNGGSITLNAGDYINIYSDIKSNGGDIELTAGSDVDGSGKIYQDSGTVIDAGWVSSASPGGNVVLNTQGDSSTYTRLASVKGDTVRIELNSDTALDDQGTTSITANSLFIDGNNHKLASTTGIHINTAVSKVSIGNFLSSSTGTIWVGNTGALEVASVLSSGIGVVNSGTGDITLTSTGEMKLTDEVIGNATVSLTSSSGDISDGNADGDNNVTASTLTLSAGGSIDIDTTVSTLNATSSGTNGITIDEADGITLGTLNTNGNGDIDIIAQGSIDANGNITASGKTVTLEADGAITHATNNGNKITANKLVVTDSFSVGDLSGNRPLDTEVSEFEVTSGGDVYISNTGDAKLNLIDSPDHDVKLVATGSILDNDSGTAPTDYDIRAKNLTLNVGSGQSIGQAGVGSELDVLYTGTFSKNTVLSDPTGLSSANHATSTWSTDNTVDASWSASTQPLYITDGYTVSYSYEWSTSASTLPDTVSDTSSTSATSSALGDGDSWYLHVRAVDNFGDASAGAGHLGKFYIDATGPSLDAPALTGTSGSNGWYLSDVNATLSSGSDDASGVAGVQYSLDGTTWNNYTGAISFISEGTTPLYTRIADNAGNTTTYQAVNVKIDKTDPTISAPVFSGTQGLDSWYITNVNTTISGSDAVSGIGSIEYSYDGANWSTYTGAFDITNQGSAVKLYSRIIDTAGRQVDNTSTPTLKIDTTAPVIDVTSPSNGVNYTTSQTLDYSVSDNLTASPDITGPAVNTVYSDLGSYTLTFKAKDAAGNESLLTLDFSIVSPTVETSQLVSDINGSNNTNLTGGTLGSTGGTQFNSFNPAPTLYFYHPITPVDGSGINAGGGGSLSNEAFEFIDGSLQGGQSGQQGGGSGSGDDEEEGEK